MNTLILVACCKRKLPHKAPARELYASPLFRMSRRWAERHGEWMILSALHGVVAPDQIITPYDVTLNTMNRAQRAAWNVRVEAQLRPFAQRRIVALAGVAYLGWMSPAFPMVETPLQGLGLGRRLAWLSRENSALR